MKGHAAPRRKETKYIRSVERKGESMIAGTSNTHTHTEKKRKEDHTSTSKKAKIKKLKYGHNKMQNRAYWHKHQLELKSNVKNSENTAHSDTHRYKVAAKLRQTPLTCTNRTTNANSTHINRRRHKRIGRKSDCTPETNW